MSDSRAATSKTGVPTIHPLPRRSLLPVAVWALLCLIWGTTWLFIKLGLRDLPPLSFAGIRFVLAFLILAAVVAIRRTPLPRSWQEWQLIAVTGVLTFTVNYGLLFWGEQRTSSGLAAILQATIPAFGLLIAHHYIPGERLTAVKAAGVTLGIAGVALIFSNEMSAEGHAAFWGSLAIVVGALAAAQASVLVKARAAHMDFAVLAAGQMICGLIPLLLVGVSLEGSPLRFHWTGLAVTSLLYLAIVGTVIAFLLFYWLVRTIEVTKTMLINLVTPFVAVVVGMLVLNEGLTWRVVIGGIAIMSGIALIVIKWGHPTP